MKLSLRVVVACVLLLLAPYAHSVYEDDGMRKSFAISRTSSAPIIDGKLDDDAWRNATMVDDFHQTVPTDGASPTEITIVRVTFDDEYLYIAADLRVQRLLGVPYTEEMIAQAVNDLATQGSDDPEDADGLVERYPNANIRTVTGGTLGSRLTEADALIAYLQVLGTFVDFELYDEKANIR